MKAVMIGVLGILAGIALAAVVLTGDSVDSVFVDVDEAVGEVETDQDKANAWSQRCEELESSVARIESNTQQVWRAPAVWADIIFAGLARDEKWDSVIVREKIVRAEERLNELKYTTRQFDPYPDGWSEERFAQWHHWALTRLATWLEEEGVSDNLPAALDERKTDGLRTVHMIFPDLPSGKINIEDIGRMMRNRHAALEEELISVQAELEHARHAQRVMQAKADRASPAIIEALEAEMYGVQLPH